MAMAAEAKSKARARTLAGGAVPIKAEVFVDGDEDRTGPVSLALTALQNCPSGADGDPVEPAAPGSSNTANQFRWDPDADWWTYNLEPTAWRQGATGGTYQGGTVDPATGQVSGGNVAGHFLVELT